MSVQILQLKAAINGSHFDLPEVKSPPYEAGVKGQWSIVEADHRDRPAVKGYFNTIVPVSGKYHALVHSSNAKDTTWMSITPLELESHAYHILWATGKVVVGGLGMGMYLYNIIQKEDVSEVFVIEKDKRVVDAFMDLANPQDWDGWDKVTILNTDLLAPDCDLSPLLDSDYLYVDIWPCVASQEALGDMKSLVNVYKPKRCGWWCQEFDIIQTVIDQGIKDNPARISIALDYLRETHGLWLKYDTEDSNSYDRLIDAAAINFIM